MIKGNESLLVAEGAIVSEAASLERVKDGRVGTAVARVLEGDAEAATAWA